MKPLDAKELQKRFLTPARQKALAAIVGDRRSCVCGVAGSSAALLLSVMPHGKAPLLVIADSQDDAGYLFHDLCPAATNATSSTGRPTRHHRYCAPKHCGASVARSRCRP